jgi:hypothetical protein
MRSTPASARVRAIKEAMVSAMGLFHPCVGARTIKIPNARRPVKIGAKIDFVLRHSENGRSFGISIANKPQYDAASQMRSAHT